MYNKQKVTTERYKRYKSAALRVDGQIGCGGIRLNQYAINTLVIQFFVVCHTLLLNRRLFTKTLITSVIKAVITICISFQSKHC